MKRILIPGWSLGDSSFGVTKPYLEYFSQFGQVEILTPRKEIVDCDLLVLPGGMDQSPKDYGEVPGFYTGNTDVYKDYFFHKNLPQYIDNKTPIFGICLGMQQICTYFGSKLTQNMYHETSGHRTELTHHVKPVVGYNKEEGYLFNPAKNAGFKVNSLHHQTVHQFHLADSLEALYIDEDGWYVEMVRHRTLPIYGIQWHEEEIQCNNVVKQTIKQLLNEQL